MLTIYHPGFKAAYQASPEDRADLNRSGLGRLFRDGDGGFPLKDFDGWRRQVRADLRGMDRRRAERETAIYSPRYRDATVVLMRNGGEGPREGWFGPSVALGWNRYDGLIFASPDGERLFIAATERLAVVIKTAAYVPRGRRGEVAAKVRAWGTAETWAGIVADYQAKIARQRAAAERARLREEERELARSERIKLASTRRLVFWRSSPRDGLQRFPLGVVADGWWRTAIVDYAARSVVLEEREPTDPGFDDIGRTRRVELSSLAPALRAEVYLAINAGIRDTAERIAIQEDDEG